MKFHVNYEEKKWLIIDLEKISRRAMETVLDLLSLEKLAKHSEVSILACNDKRILNYNKAFRNKKNATNVLSWPKIENLHIRSSGVVSDHLKVFPITKEPIEMGDIAISYETCLREAKDLQVNFEHYVLHLLIHSSLHLLGYAHKTDEEYEIMRDLEIKSLSRCGIPYQFKSLMRY